MRAFCSTIIKIQKELRETNFTPGEISGVSFLISKPGISPRITHVHMLTHLG